MRRRSAAAVSMTTPRSDSSSETRVASRDGPSSPMTSSRSTVASARMTHGVISQNINPSRLVSTSSKGESR